MDEYQHVEERDDSYYIRGHRIPLITLIFHWNNGDAPETIRRRYPTLSLADIYGGIVYYLDHRDTLDEHFAKVRAEEAVSLADLDAKHQEFRTRIRQRAASLRQHKEAPAS